MILTVLAPTSSEFARARTRAQHFAERVWSATRIDRWPRTLRQRCVACVCGGGVCEYVCVCMCVSVNTRPSQTEPNAKSDGEVVRPCEPDTAEAWHFHQLHPSPASLHPAASPWPLHPSLLCATGAGTPTSSCGSRCSRPCPSSTALPTTSWVRRVGRAGGKGRLEGWILRAHIDVCWPQE